MMLTRTLAKGGAISRSPDARKRAGFENEQTGRDFVPSGDLEIAPPCSGVLIAIVSLFALALPLLAQNAPISSLAALKQVSSETRSPHPINLDATVWFADATNGHLILHDSSDTAEVLMDFDGLTFAPGERVRISGTCTLMNRSCGFEITRLAVVDNDGIHTERERSGSVHLEAGRHPIRVDWFNASSDAKLRVEYAGPGFSRRPIANADLRPGLDFRTYKKRLWMLPAHSAAMSQSTSGVAKNFDASIASGQEYVGADFSGFLEIHEAGEYTFFLTSDDGSRLFLGPSSLRVEKLDGSGRESGLSSPQTARSAAIANQNTGALRASAGWKARAPVTSDPLPEPVFSHPGQTLTGEQEYVWSVVEGRASQASHAENENYLWLDSGAGHTRVEVADAIALPWSAVLTNPVRITGVLRRGHSLDGAPIGETLFVQDGARVEILNAEDAKGLRGMGESPAPLNPPITLTTVAQIERFNRSILDEKPAVRVRGVVTRVVSTVVGIVLQDESRGIYVNIESIASGPIQIGELLEIVGVVEAGEFSPYITATEIIRRGAGIMPAPVRASREEMTNGSLHSQYVEIEGYVLAVDARTVTLRTRAGVLRVETETETSPAWLNAVVRMRGCLRVFWDVATKQITPGKVGLDYAEISIERAAPADLFAVSKKRVAELLKFDPYAETFQRTRLVGQLVHASGSELCLMDEGQGLRVSLVGAAAFERGDVLEIAGFPEFDGPTPHFDHAIARKIGREPLPPARALPAEKLLSDDYDSTRVSVDAELLDSGFQDGNWTLQLRAGANTFRVRFDAVEKNKDAQKVLSTYAPGSRLRLTGVYRGLGGNRNLGVPVGAFELLLNSRADIAVLATPPWWTLARLLAVVGVLCVVLLLAFLWITALRRRVTVQTAQLETVLEERHRVQQAEALAKERSRLAYDLHDELGAGLSEIGLLSTLAASPLTQEKRLGYFSRLSETARRLIASLDEIVWAVNPRYDAVSSFAGYYTAYAQQFLELAELRCRLDVADDLPQHPLTTRVRHTLFLAFKEALTNVAKHAHATEVVIRILTENAHLIISVTDDGRGINVSDGSNWRPGAHGLTGITERLRQLDGECVIESCDPHGTRVSLRVPL